MAEPLHVAILTIQRKVVVKEVKEVYDYSPGLLYDVLIEHDEPFLIFDLLMPSTETKNFSLLQSDTLLPIEKILSKRDVFLFKYIENNLFRSPTDSIRLQGNLF